MRGRPCGPALVLALLAAAPAAAQQAGSAPPEVIPGGAGLFLSPRARVEDVAAGPGGRLEVVFADARGTGSSFNRVLYARRGPGGWSAPVPVDDTPGEVRAPRLVVDAAGRTHLFWWKSRAVLLHRVVSAATDTLYREPDPRGVSDPQLAAATDGAGRIHLVHARAEGGHAYRVYDRGRWGAGPAPAAPGGYLRLDRAAAREGRVELVYVAARASALEPRANNDLWVRSLAADGWAAPMRVFAASSRTHDPVLLTDGRGVRHAAWTERSGRGRSERILHAASAGGARWSSPGDVVPMSADVDYYAPRLGRDARGRPRIVFLRSDRQAVTPQTAVLRDGRWTAPRPLAPGAAASTLDLELADDGHGALYAVWRGMDGRFRCARLPR